MKFLIFMQDCFILYKLVQLPIIYIIIVYEIQMHPFMFLRPTRRLFHMWSLFHQLKNQFVLPIMFVTHDR